MAAADEDYADKTAWVPDDASPTCLLCGGKFNGYSVRRHHCRVCGKLVCGTCSRARVARRGKAVRACRDCAAPSPQNLPAKGARDAVVEENQRWAASWAAHNLLPMDPHVAAWKPRCLGGRRAVQV